MGPRGGSVYATNARARRRHQIDRTGVVRPSGRYHAPVRSLRGEIPAGRASRLNFWFGKRSQGALIAAGSAPRVIAPPRVGVVPSAAAAPPRVIAPPRVAVPSAAPASAPPAHAVTTREPSAAPVSSPHVVVPVPLGPSRPDHQADGIARGGAVIPPPTFGGIPQITLPATGRAPTFFNSAYHSASSDRPRVPLAGGGTAIGNFPVFFVRENTERRIWVICDRAPFVYRDCAPLPSTSELISTIPFDPRERASRLPFMPILLSVVASPAAPDGPREHYNVRTSHGVCSTGGVHNYAQHRVGASEYFGFVEFRVSAATYIGLFAFCVLARNLRIMIDYGAYFRWDVRPIILPYFADDELPASDDDAFAPHVVVRAGTM